MINDWILRMIASISHHVSLNLKNATNNDEKKSYSLFPLNERKSLIVFWHRVSLARMISMVNCYKNVILQDLNHNVFHNWYYFCHHKLHDVQWKGKHGRDRRKKKFKIFLLLPALFLCLFFSSSTNLYFKSVFCPLHLCRQCYKLYFYFHFYDRWLLSSSPASSYLSLRTSNTCNYVEWQIIIT